MREWSQEELAHEADSNRTYISDVERGTRNPSIEVVERIAKALGVSIGSLLDPKAGKKHENPQFQI